MRARFTLPAAVLTLSGCTAWLYDPAPLAESGSEGGTSLLEGSSSTGEGSMTSMTTTGSGGGTEGTTEAVASTGFTTNESDGSTTGTDTGSSSSGDASSTGESPRPDPCVPDQWGKDNPGDGCLGGEKVRLIFVTSNSYDGNLGGLAGADGKCNEMAQAAGYKGTFKAWLSSAWGEAAVSRMAGSPMAELPIIRPDGAKVADSWLNFVSGWWSDCPECTLVDADRLLHEISVTEKGTVVSGQAAKIWSASFPDGSRASLSILDTCHDWTSNLQLGPCGLRGSVVFRNHRWSIDYADQGQTLWACSSCDLFRRLVCLQYELPEG